MSSQVRELVTISAEFIISLVVLIGGGFMLYNGENGEFASGIIATVITFWFVRRQNETQAKTITDAQANQAAQQNQPPKADQ